MTDKNLIQKIVADYYKRNPKIEKMVDEYLGRCLVCDAPATEDRLCELHQDTARTELLIQWRNYEDLCV